MAAFMLVKKEKAKSHVWEHFALKKRKHDGVIEENVAICRLCDGQVKCTGGGTSNMTAHIRRHHPNANNNNNVCVSHFSGNSNVVKAAFVNNSINKSSESISASPPSASCHQQQTIHTMFSNKTLYRPDSAKAKLITEKIAKFIVKDLRPYRIVETREFKDLVKELDPRYRLPSRKQFSEVTIPKLYNDVKMVVTNQLQSSSQVALTSDGWTSRSTESYVTITATFIDVNWELVNLVLQTRPLPESHTADNIAAVITEAVAEWKLPTSLGGTIPPIVSDNAANMLKAGKILECTVHIGCLAHTINLAVQKSLKVKSVSHLLARIRNIVSFFHRSAVASAVLKSKAELLGLPNHKLKIDVCTRWNSAYDMITRFLELQAAIVATVTSKEVVHMKDRAAASMSNDNIILAQDVSSMLKPLKDITTMLCSESLPTVSVIMPLHYRLTTQILIPKEGDLPTIAEMKNIMRSDLTERYSDKSDFLNLASAIDPRFKTLPYLSVEKRVSVYSNFTKEAIHISTVAPGIKVKTENVSPVMSYREAAAAAEPPLPSLPCLEGSPDTLICTSEHEKTDSTVTTVSTPVKSGLNEILGDVFVTHIEPAKSVQDLAEMEVNQYKVEAPISLGENPLQWWKQREIRYPILSKLAKCLLCIPATSVPSERVFSTAGDIVTAQRANLKAKHVDQLIFLKKNWT